MAFHPYPQLIRAVFNPQRFGPPRSVTHASSWPWIDHSVSRLPPHTMFALFRLAFATGTDIHILTLACDEQLVGSLCKRHAVTEYHCWHPLRPFVSTWVQVLFTPFLRVLFTFPSRYWFTIGHRGVFSLGGWSPQIHTGFLVSRATQDTPRATLGFIYRTLTVFGRPSQTVRLPLVDPMLGSYNPGYTCVDPVWALPRSLAAT